MVCRSGKGTLETVRGDNMTKEQNELVENNMNLAYWVARKFYGSPHYGEDMNAAALLGLVKSALHFDPATGNKFTTYAVFVIQNEILMFLRRERRQEGVVHFSDIICQGKGTPITLEDCLGSDDDMETQIIENQELARVLRTLDRRELDIISSLFGLAGCEKLTQHDLAKKYGVSQSYISRLQSHAIKKLKRKW